MTMLYPNSCNNQALSALFENGARPIELGKLVAFGLKLGNLKFSL